MTTSTTSYTLCLITVREAQHLQGAPALAGGWVATSDVCRMAVEDVTGAPLLLAMLPSDWSEARPWRQRETLEAIAARLERCAAGTGSEVAADFAARIRAGLALERMSAASGTTGPRSTPGA
jgi:hypothetical protein